MIQTKDFRAWHFEEEINLMVCDVPFNLKFTGKPSNYNRLDSVVEGYVEWNQHNVEQNLLDVLLSAEKYLKKAGNLLVFTGWQISQYFSYIIEKYKQTPKRKNKLKLMGKLYWEHNFVPYCKNKPAHNIYEIYWFAKQKKPYYANECSFDHCTEGESNLSTIFVKKEYIRNMPKYPTKLPRKLLRILIEHFSPSDGLILDPLCGSGMCKIVTDLYYSKRTCFAGDLNPMSIKIFDIYKAYYKALEKA